MKATVKKAPAKSVDTVDGRELYLEFCAVCHGTDGKGSGPAASALKHAPPDLTRMSKRNGGVFPANRVQQLIDGDENVPAHGNREMPIWGRILRSTPADRSSVKLRVYNLMKHLESMQVR
jgi:mono/diheme cytochrome c family protein